MRWKQNLKVLKKTALFTTAGIAFLAFFLITLGVFDEKTEPGKTKENFWTPKDMVGKHVVQLQMITPCYKAVGTVSSKKRIVISSQIRGIVQKVYFREGNSVKKGQALIKITDDEWKTKKEQANSGIDIAEASLQQAIQTRSMAQANYNQTQSQAYTAKFTAAQAQQKQKAAEAALEQAKAQYERIQGFKEKGTATPQQYEEARAHYLQAKAAMKEAQLGIEIAKEQREAVKQLLKSAKATMKQSEQRIQEAKARLQQAKQYVQQADIALGYTEILAPEDGVIVEKQVEPGDLAWPGKPLLVIHKPKLLQLEAEVRESLRQRIEYGQELTVLVSAMDYEKKAKITEIIPSADPATRTFLVKLSLTYQKGLYPGMFGSLCIPLEQIRAITVPTGAIRQIGQFESVYVEMEPNRWTRRFITTGKIHAKAKKVEVLSGLSAGETVALLKE